MSTPFLFFKQISLPDTGQTVPLDISGTFIICTQASAGKFQMSFDGGVFFDFQKGLDVSGQDFTQLIFRIKPGTTLQNDIEIYYGNVTVKDSRLNVINETDLATIYVKPAPYFYVSVLASITGGTGTMSKNFTNGDVRGLSGILTIGGVNFYRRSIGWSTYTPTGTVSLPTQNKPITITAGGVALRRSVYDLPGELFIGQVTGDDMQVRNDSGADVPCDLWQTFWNN